MEEMEEMEEKEGVDMFCGSDGVFVGDRTLELHDEDELCSESFLVPTIELLYSPGQELN